MKFKPTVAAALCFILTLAACRTGGDPTAWPLPTDPQIEPLVAHINDNPDLMHSDYTPAARELMLIGERSLPYVLSLMESDDRFTRIRAIRVLENVTQESHGFVRGQGWNNTDGQEQWRAFWKSLGDLSYDGSTAKRKRSIRLWRNWIQSRQTTPANQAGAVDPPIAFPFASVSQWRRTADQYCSLSWSIT